MYVVNSEKVRDIMLEKNIKVRDLVVAGISARTAADIMKDRAHTGFHISTIHKLSHALGVNGGSIAEYK